ncbi:MAG: DNA-3-methyladenine glycosylase 2 family protein [Pseudonocardiales bacterium]
MTTFEIIPRGPFSLGESATFGFGQRDAAQWDHGHSGGVMRLAFCLDGYGEQVGVEVRQHAERVECVVHGDADVAAVRRQVARVLSLDHDGEEYVSVGRRDPVVARLLQAAPGLRPPLFYSPYEAAAWSVLSARRPARQMAQVRTRLSERFGRIFSVAGEPTAALPTPDQLLAVDAWPGLTAEKIVRLHGVARAALAGQLDADRLLSMDPGEAMTDLRSIRGIGPFASALIVIRATGFTDVLPTQEPQLLGRVAQLYGLPGPPSPEQFADLAEAWRPFRTWVAVLIRAAASRLPTPG